MAEVGAERSMPKGRARQPARRGIAALPTAIGVLSKLAAERAIQAGIDVGPLLQRSGLPKSLIEDPEIRISAQSQIVFLNLVADVLNDNLLGFHLARDMDLRELGSFYYVMASSERLGDAIAREARYSVIVDEGLKIRYRKTSALSVEFEYAAVRRHVDQHHMEFWVTCTLRKCRLFTNRELVPTYVGFVHRHEGDLSEMERYLARDLTFGAAKDQISFEPQAADLPLVTADPYLNRFLVKYHEDVIAQRQARQDPLRTCVENAITLRLPHGTVNIGTIAADLGMSVRTLSRRLAEEGLTFRAVLGDLRGDLADRYLQNDELSISQIAWLLGYTEVSSFVHAFRRRAGKSPRAARPRARSSAGPE